MMLMKHTEPGMELLIDEENRITLNGFQVVRHDYGLVLVGRGDLAVRVYRERLQLIANWTLYERYIETSAESIDRDPAKGPQLRMNALLITLRDLVKDIGIGRALLDAARPK